MSMWIRVIVGLSLALPATIWAWKVLPEYLKRGD